MTDSFKSNILDQNESFDSQNELATNEANNLKKEFDSFLKPFSPEWRQVEFHLKSTINSYVEIKDIEKLHNQHMLTNFTKRSSSKTTSFAWINEDNLTENNYADKIKARGFEIDNSGLDFSVGTPISSKEVDFNKDWTFTYLFCKIIVGRTFYDKQRDNRNYRKAMNFDSHLLFSEDNLNENKLTRSNLSKYTYRIFNSSNALPLYKVNFAVLLSKPGKEVRCADCDTEIGTRYCLNCDANLCLNCDKRIHDNYSKVLGIYHTVEDMQNSENGYCYFCVKNEAKKYCSKCDAAICLTCLSKGSHSMGEMAHHAVDEIKEKKNSCNPDSSSWEAYGTIKKSFDQLESLKSRVGNCIK